MKYLLLLLLSSCAHSTLYVDGKPVAYLQGDVQRLHYHRTPCGAITVTMEGVNHSEPTRAQGQSGAGKLTAVGQILTAAAAGAAMNP